MSPQNQAAFLSAAQANPLGVGSVDYPTVGDGEIIVKVAVAAINPMDWYVQLMGANLFPWLKYPYTPGSDVAGEVVEVGPGVTRFKKGDRIVSLAAGFDSRNGGFQTYAALLAGLSSPIPDDLDYADAAVLPLGLATAAAGLFQKDHLALDYPKVGGATANGKTVLIWAGSSSVGSNAIQLAVAAGYEVITTASPKNFDYCKKLGAAHVFDYKSDTLTEDLLRAFKGKTSAGGFAIQRGCEKVIFEVISKTEGNKFVTCAMPVPEDKPEGIGAKFIFSSTIKDNEVGPLIFEEYLPVALAKKAHQIAPPPRIIGHGLDKIQEGYNLGKSGATSAQKLVVIL
ncbi:putative zinc-binding alcohol dehydrogenase domain-containing protein cipB [Coniella lustricola]|uniref:Putative zinc-binding alcohol dehydrogenase domain-containing protein cipB n=1 Tax=Coniella lustricola TaxID=2025994 RepID=A0A2T3A264_9PEZI|nr:putative zinc-binding alcohol dehydrogenase domain-containing protein cipB [Coniella lustricola]